MLCPNSTHVLQPLDVVVFGPLKKRLENLCHDWHNNVENSGKQMTKYGFLASVAYEAFERTLKDGELVKKGFEVCGLVPWRPGRVNLSKLKPSSIYEEDNVPSRSPNTGANDLGAAGSGGQDAGQVSPAQDPPHEDRGSETVGSGEGAGAGGERGEQSSGPSAALEQLTTRDQLRFELFDEIELSAPGAAGVAVGTDAAAAKLAAQQESLTLDESKRKLGRFELTLDPKDIALFEFLYSHKVMDVDNNDYRAWCLYKRASEPAIERFHNLLAMHSVSKSFQNPDM